MSQVGYQRVRCQAWCKSYGHLRAKLKHVLWLGDLKASLRNSIEKFIYKTSSSVPYGWGKFKELLWLRFWCQASPIIFMVENVYILIFGIKKIFQNFQMIPPIIWPIFQIFSQMKYETNHLKKWIFLYSKYQNVHIFPP